MSLALGIIALLAGVVVLATKIVELWSTIIKYRKENPKPVTTVTTTATPKAATSTWSDLLIELFGLLVLLLAFAILFLYSLSRGPATKQDLASVGFAIVLCVASYSMRSRP